MFSFKLAVKLVLCCCISSHYLSVFCFRVSYTTSYRPAVCFFFFFCSEARPIGIFYQRQMAFIHVNRHPRATPR